MLYNFLVKAIRFWGCGFNTSLILRSILYNSRKLYGIKKDHQIIG
jgi:hypothetical protein